MKKFKSFMLAYICIMPYFLMFSVSNAEKGYLKGSQAIGDEFQVNTYVEDNQDGVDVAIADNGNFVITWQCVGQDGDGYGVFAQMYGNDGNPIGSEFQVNSYEDNNQGAPSVAMDEDGNFIIVWHSNYHKVIGQHETIYAQRYDQKGDIVGGEFRVNSSSLGDHFYPYVAMNSKGDFVLSWRYLDSENSKKYIYAKKYNSDGSVKVNDFMVSETESTYIKDPHIGIDINDSGTFVITWFDSDGSDEFPNIYAKLYDKDGNLVKDIGHANTRKVNSHYPSVSLCEEGEFFITWGMHNQIDINGVFVRKFDKLGNPLSEEIQVNTFATLDTNASQNVPDIGIDKDGNFVIAWMSYGQDGSGWGIYAQLFKMIISLVHQK